MQKFLVPIIATLFLGACALPKGHYQLKAIDSEGKELNNGLIMTAEGSRIYSVRNALCISYPKSRVVIFDVQTKQELAGESPYQCR